MNMDGALKDVTAWYAEHRRFMNEQELGAIVAKHTNNDEEAAQLIHFLASDVGRRWLAVHLQQRKEELGLQSKEPRHDVGFEERFQDELTKELRDPFGGLLAAGRFPKRDEAIQKLGKVTVAHVHDNGDVTVRSGGKLYLVTTQGETSEQTPSYLQESEKLTEHSGRVYLREGEKQPEGVQVKIGMLGLRYYEVPKKASHLDTAVDVASKAGSAAVSALPGGKLLGAGIQRSAEIAKERIAEKKGVPWQMAAFGPLGSFLVPRKSYLREGRPDWAEEFKGIGGRFNADGTVTLYHATTKDKAEQIIKEGVLRRPSDAPDYYGVYFSSSPSVAEDYGDGTLIRVRVKASDLHPDDVFPGRRMDFNVPTTGGLYRPAGIESYAIEGYAKPAIPQGILDRGQELAVQLGNGVRCDGPYMKGEKVVGFFMTDVAVTGTTFFCNDLEGCKERLVIKRKQFGARPPEFLILTKDEINLLSLSRAQIVNMDLSAKYDWARKLGYKGDFELLTNKDVPIIESYILDARKDALLRLAGKRYLKQDSPKIRVGDEELTGSSHHQRDLELVAYCDDKVCGSLSYALFEDLLWVKYIRVDPPYERKGVATALVNRMKELNPGREIKLSTMTPEGRAFFTAIGLFVPPKPKELWQMTRAEYLAPFEKAYREASEEWDRVYHSHIPDSLVEAANKKFQSASARWSGEAWDAENALLEARQAWETDPRHDELDRERTSTDRKEQTARSAHEKAVRQALREGLPVPAEVLKDYPNMVVRKRRSYLVETDDPEACEMLAPQYWDLLPLLNSVPISYSLLVEPEAKGRKIDEILKRLKEGVESISSSANFREFLITMAKFHDYSIGNQIPHHDSEAQRHPGGWLHRLEGPIRTAREARREGNRDPGALHAAEAQAVRDRRRGRGAGITTAPDVLQGSLCLRCQPDRRQTAPRGRGPVANRRCKRGAVRKGARP